VELVCVGLGCKFCRTGQYRFGGQIVWNWTVKIRVVENFVELYCIGFGTKFCGTGMYRIWGAKLWTRTV
jgi:hypothetical protein